MPIPETQYGIVFRHFSRGNKSSSAATNCWLIFYSFIVGTIIFYIQKIKFRINMNKVLRWIRAVFIAMINICLLCGAGYVLDWLTYLFKKLR